MSDRETLLTLAKVAKAFVEWLERWPDSEKTCSPGCDSVTPPASGDETVTAEPDPGEGYRWVEPRSPGCPGETLRHDDECKPAGGGSVEWACTNAVGDECVTRHFYRRRIDAAPETTPVPAVAMTGPGSTQAERWLPGEIGAEQVAECEGVHELRSLETMLGPVVRRTDAERLIAAARREAEEARAECERLRMTDEEREAIALACAYLERIGVRGTSLQQALLGLLARHDKGGAA
jgi:hypothetical protein